MESGKGRERADCPSAFHVDRQRELRIDGVGDPEEGMNSENAGQFLVAQGMNPTTPRARLVRILSGDKIPRTCGSRMASVRRVL
jgi:hypothetical protein